MGLFSFKCALSGIEIAGPACDVAPGWMSDVVAFRADGTPVQGQYDGYGRLTTVDGDEFNFFGDVSTADEAEEALKGTKVVLSRFYKGQKAEDLPFSEYGEWQGWYIPLSFIEAVEGLALAYEQEGIKAPQGNWPDDDEEEYEDELIDAM